LSVTVFITQDVKCNIIPSVLILPIAETHRRRDLFAQYVKK